ncbi:MAG: hypothetical protein K1X89_26475 [Myxococcaceae bacterium]|nr:hypothetical protein [Myxococcaceae bacterium]
MSSGPVRLDPTPARISTNLSIERQTPKRDFGDRVKVGLDNVGGAISSGASVVAGALPGGAIVSAAVSSVSHLSNQSSGGAVTSSYAMQALSPVNNPVINTTVPTGGTAPNLGGSVGSAPNALGTAGSGNTLGQMNSDLVQAQADNAKLMQVQIAMQRENQVFTSVSNVLKTRHDTVKNSISNIR